MWQWNYDRPKQPWNGIVNDWYMGMGDAITIMIGFLVCRLCDMMRSVLYIHFIMLSAVWTQNRFSVHSCGKCIDVLILNTSKLRLKSQRNQNLFHSVCPEPRTPNLSYLFFFFPKMKESKAGFKIEKIHDWKIDLSQRDIFIQFPPSFYIDLKSICMLIKA